MSVSSTYFDRVIEAAAAIQSRIGPPPDVAIVLGSGLGGFAEDLDGPTRVPYGELPHWPASRVVGHAGVMVAGRSS